MKRISIRLGPWALFALVCLALAGAIVVLLLQRPATAAPGDVPVVGFTAPSFTVREQDGAATITVRVSARPEAGRRVLVHYLTLPGTATEGAGGDYLHATGVLTFTRNTPTTQAFTVTVLDDAEDNEPAETVNLVLSLLTPNTATLGTNVATLVIIDNDGPTPTPTVTRPANLDEASYLQPILSGREATKTPPAPPSP